MGHGAGTQRAARPAAPPRPLPQPCSLLTPTSPTSRPTPARPAGPRSASSSRPPAVLRPLMRRSARSASRSPSSYMAARRRGWDRVTCSRTSAAAPCGSSGAARRARAGVGGGASGGRASCRLRPARARASRRRHKTPHPRSPRLLPPPLSHLAPSPSDSHTKQLFKSLTCFMYDFWDGRDCKVSPDDYLVKQLDTLPMMPGESKCLHLLGETRICRVGSVLGSSLLNNPAVRWRGAVGRVGSGARGGAWQAPRNGGERGVVAVFLATAGCGSSRHSKAAAGTRGGGTRAACMKWVVPP